jgi:hypothetical protein
MQLLRSKLPFALVTAVLLGGCDLALDPRDDLEGFYDYAGTVYGSPGFSVNGQLDIDQGYRTGSDADAELDWNFYEGSRRVVRIETVRTVPVYVGHDGRFDFTVEGRLEVGSGQYRDFRLTHDGYRDGRTLRGTWRLVTDLPSDDRGNFSARR